MLPYVMCKSCLWELENKVKRNTIHVYLGRENFFVSYTEKFLKNKKRKFSFLFYISLHFIVLPFLNNFSKYSLVYFLNFSEIKQVLLEDFFFFFLGTEILLALCNLKRKISPSDFFF